MMQRNKLVPELMVTDLNASLEFWVSWVGFTVAYQRLEEGFAYLDLNGAQVMLEQIDPRANQWQTAALDLPLGRGMNLQIHVAAVGPLIERLDAVAYPVFKPCEDVWYRAGEVEVGQREFLVQDPDGYLVRLVERLGERARRLDDGMPT
ncbi:VOC family protein [Pseudomonas sp. LBUM920]|uniref:bleomycin resistance protein n=1 Tax=Pseudomonas sp. LBUM920 TaxID=2126069 RepID=UPI000F5706BF|nr:VOC family protein [Pseudomonas sp. LBUM920]